MLTSPKGPTLAADTTQTRYQKALKEITKLISLNNELKEEAHKNEEIVDSLKIQVKEMSYQLQKNHEEKERLSLEYDKLYIKYRDLEEDFMQMEEKAQGKNQQSYKFVFHSNDIDTIRSSNESGAYLKKIQQLEQKNMTIQKRIEDQEEFYQNNVQDLQLKNRQLKGKLKTCEELIAELGSQKTDKSFVFTDKEFQNLDKAILLRKLKIAYIWNQNTSKECVQLKAKILNYENQSSILSRIKSEKKLPTIPTVNSTNSIYESKMSFPIFSENNMRNQTQIYKKLKVSEEEKRSLSKKYEQLKGRLEAIDRQFDLLVKQNDKNQKMITGYEKLIEKQQSEIQRLIREYEEDMKKATEDFKAKLIEQRQNFGPTGNVKQAKAIQTLQIQNKSLKKKVQMCSFQLSKCFKALQAYKQKISEYQMSCNELLAENQKLSRKVKQQTKEGNIFTSESPKQKIELSDEEKEVKVEIESLCESLEKRKIPMKTKLKINS